MVQDIIVLSWFRILLCLDMIWICYNFLKLVGDKVWHTDWFNILVMWIIRSIITCWIQPSFPFFFFSCLGDYDKYLGWWCNRGKEKNCLETTHLSQQLDTETRVWVHPTKSSVTRKKGKENVELAQAYIISDFCSLFKYKPWFYFVWNCTIAPVMLLII